jgi:hypothetical protein
MKRRLVALLAICLLLAGGVRADHHIGTAGAPPAQPGAVPGTVEPPPPGSGSGQKALTWAAPAGWQAQVPSSSMRKAQYRISGDAGAAECVVFYFGPGQGGDAMANAERWAAQFTLADGRPGKEGMQVEKRTVGDIEVLLVSVSGTHQGGFRMQAQPQPPKPDQMLLAAVAKGPDANWFFKLLGPKATVEAQRSAFDALIASLKPGSPQP